MTGLAQSDPALFEEQQRFRQWWLWAPILLLALMPLWIALPPLSRLPRHGSETIGWMAYAIGVGSSVGILGLARLTVRVTPRELHIRFFPFFVDRHIAIPEVAKFFIRTYNPLLAGYGIHISSYGWVYNVSGREGVQVELVGRKRLLIGSRRAQELAAALAQAGARQA
jgi:hypothetical protein